MSRPLTLLYVDGSPADRIAVREALEGEPVHVLGVADAQKGMSAARLYRPDVIVLETDPPGMRAEEMIRLLRADRHLAHTRIITVGTENPLRQDGLARLGSTFYLLKPVDAARLKQLVFAQP